MYILIFKIIFEFQILAVILRYLTSRHLATLFNRIELMKTQQSGNSSMITVSFVLFRPFAEKEQTFQ